MQDDRSRCHVRFVCTTSSHLLTAALSLHVNVIVVACSIQQMQAGGDNCSSGGGVGKESTLEVAYQVKSSWQRTK